MFTVILDANNKVIHDPSQNDSGLLVVGGVINKQVNCADSFTFTIYPDNVGYSDIEIMTTWLSVLKDGEVIFHGRVLAEKTGWNNEKEITCEGDLAILNDSILRPYSFSGTLSDYMIMLINQHNAQVGADKQIVIKTVDNPTTQMIRRTADYKPTLQELFEKIVDYFGGYLVIEIENGVRKISYVTDSTSGTNQTLEIGKNIIDFNRTIAAEALATAIIPLGATSEETGQRLTIKTVNEGSDFLTSPDAATKGLIYAVYTFDGITDPAELKAKGQAVLEDLTRIVPRIELSAVDLSSAGYDIDAIGFFQYVTVQDNAHTVSGQYLITERTYNISAPEQDKVTFGGQEKTISGQSTKTQIDLSSVEDTVINKAVDIVQYQTDLLKGASGGFFVIGTNSQGKPSETYWMDTDSTATARKVLRINYNGIGFSANGISGPYDSAWTLDGNFNANFIRVGTLNCDLITVTNLDGSSIKANTLELNKFSNAAQAAIVSNAQTQQEYYLSTSDASATGGSWSTTIPAWTPGKYIWTRTKNTVTNSAGTSSASYIPSAAGQYDSALTTALSTADAASGTAGSALVSSVPLYYRSTSSTAPAKPVAEISSAGTGSDVWTLAMPAPSNGCYFFTCNQFKTASGTVSWSDVREISSATYTSKWCASADATYIDGGQIYTGSVTADKIKANEVFAQKLYAQDFNITGGSINITTASETYDVIKLINDTWVNSLSPLELKTFNTNTKYAFRIQAGGIFGYSDYVDGTGGNIRTRIYAGSIRLHDSNGKQKVYLADTGTIQLNDSNGDLRIVENALSAGGMISIYSGASGSPVAMVNMQAQTYGGVVSVKNPSGQDRAALNVTSNDSGAIYVNNSNGNTVVTMRGNSGFTLTHWNNNTGYGIAQVWENSYGATLKIGDLSGNDRVRAEVSSSGNGGISLYASNNVKRTDISALNIYQYNASGTQTMRLDGTNGRIYPLGSSDYIHDFIIAEGTSGRWWYRKWHSGMCELFGSVAAASRTFSAWGSSYVSAKTTAVAYPFTFKSRPREFYAMFGTNSVLLQKSSENTTTQSAEYEGVRAVSGRASFGIDLYVWGELA